MSANEPMLFEQETPRFTKVYLDQRLRVSTRAFERAKQRKVPRELLEFLQERRVSNAIDCSQARNAEELWYMKGRLAEIESFLGLFEAED